MRHAALVALLLVTACQAPPPPAPEFTDADRQAVADEVSQASQDWMAAWARNDIDATMATLVDDPEAYFVGDPGVWVNNLSFTPTVEEVRAGWETLKETRSASRMFPSQESIAVLSPDHAVQVWVGEWNVTDAEGVTTPNARMTATFVWVRQGAEWRMLHWTQHWTRTPVEG